MVKHDTIRVKINNKMGPYFTTSSKSGESRRPFVTTKLFNFVVYVLTRTIINAQNQGNDDGVFLSGSSATARERARGR